MEQVFGVAFLVAGALMLTKPGEASAFIREHQLFGPRGRGTPEIVMRLLGASFVVVGGLVVVGQWPPG